MTPLFALEFPPISHVIEWPGIALKDTPFEINKVVILMWAAVLIVFGLFWAAGRAASSGRLVPSGVQMVDGPRTIKERHLKMTFAQDGRRFDVSDPATDTVFASVPDSGAVDARAALEMEPDPPLRVARPFGEGLHEASIELDDVGLQPAQVV